MERRIQDEVMRDMDSGALTEVHSKNRGVKITPPVLIEDHTMHFTPVLNLWC